VTAISTTSASPAYARPSFHPRSNTFAMGNSQGREARPGSSREQQRASNAPQATSPTAPAFDESSRHGRSVSAVYNSRSGRGSRHDLSFLGIGTSSSERDPALEPRRETKAEREARKLEKERQLRLLERERSLREEGVDGGFLVTLGVYTGPEDYSKPAVRQLQVGAIKASQTPRLTAYRLSAD
jgi:hypothetical protein